MPMSTLYLTGTAETHHETDCLWVDAEGRYYSGEEIADLMRAPRGCGPFYSMRYLAMLGREWEDEQPTRPRRARRTRE